ncbi:MAG: PadR family transcriptional regulator [Candidatus Aenigmatarchaeota archaeon]
MSINRHIPEIELGLLQMQILWLLNKKGTHGYELMKRLSDLKTTKITQGTLYPTLQRLEELKLIKSREDDRRKVYILTDKGKKTMKDSCADFCKTFHGIFEDFICGKCR